MRLSQINESVLNKELALPTNYDGYLYKALYIAPKENPWKLYKIPGYCWTTPIDEGTAFSRSAVGREAPFVGVVRFKTPPNMLNYFPSEATIDSGYSYDRNTHIKPGWYGNIIEQNIADMAIVTVPQRLELIALYGTETDGIKAVKGPTLIGLEAYGNEGRIDDFDLWACNIRSIPEVVSQFGKITKSRAESFDVCTGFNTITYKIYIHKK